MWRRGVSLALGLMFALGQSVHAQQVAPVVRIPITKERVSYYNVSEDGKGLSCGVYLYGSFPVYKGRTNISDYAKPFFTPGLTPDGSLHLDPDGRRFRFYVTFTGVSGPIALVNGCPSTIGENLPDWYVEYIPKAPVASFTATAITSEPGAWNFQSTSTDPEGQALTEKWVFGNGGTGSGQGEIYRYTKPGFFNTSLTVTDTDGLTNRAARTIKVPAPTLAVSLKLVSKHSGNRIEPREEFRVRVTVSAGSGGVGDLTDVKFDGPPLDIPMLFSIVSAPSNPLIGTLKPGESSPPFEWTLRAGDTLGDFTFRTSTASGTDAANQPVVAAAKTLEGTVTTLIVGIEQRPARMVLGEDNNGDGVINAEDKHVQIVIGVTNVAQQDVTEVRTDNLNAPLAFTSRLEGVPVALEPVGAHSGDFGTIRPGAANAVVHTNVFLATNYVSATASFLVRGNLGGVPVETDAETLVKVQNPVVEITMHALEKSGLTPESIAADSINAPLVPLTVGGSLDAQPQISGGLIGDGVTPLLFILEADTNSLAVANEDLKIRLVAAVKSGGPLKGDDVQSRLKVLKTGAWVSSDLATMTQAEPKVYAYLTPIKSDDIEIGAGSGVLRASLTVKDSESGTKLKELEFGIRKPPIALVHGANSDGSAWTQGFRDILRASRPDDGLPLFSFVKVVRYGQRTESQEALPDQSSERMINITWPLDSLAPMLEAALTREMDSLRHNWAFTRYDVVGHSQGGVLLRMLCSQNANGSVGQPFRNEGNFFRGRFHRVITIGAPHNGTRIVPYLLALASLSGTNPDGDALPVIVAKKLVEAGASAKFDPWGQEIFNINRPADSAPWFPDSRAGIHLVRTTVGGGLPPGSTKESTSWADTALWLNLPPPKIVELPPKPTPSETNGFLKNGAINWMNNSEVLPAVDEHQDNWVEEHGYAKYLSPDSRYRSPGQIVFARGSDGVVDFDSMGPGLLYDQKSPNVYDVPNSYKISHSAITVKRVGNILGGSDGGQLESPVVAKHVIEALDQTGEWSETEFGAFRLPKRLPDSIRKSIEVLTQYYVSENPALVGHNLLELNVVNNKPAANKVRIASGDPRTFTLSLTPRPGQPVWNGEVLWLAEVYGTNGVTTEGLTLIVDTNDPTRATLQVNEEIVGDVVAYAQYHSVWGIVVCSKPLRVASFEPASPAVELRVLPLAESLPVGTTLPIEVFVRHQNGLWLQRHVKRSEIGVTSQEPLIVNVDNPLRPRCLSSGKASVSVTWRGLSNTATVTVFGFPEDTSPIPEPLVWLRADAGLSLTNGTNVVSWTDQSRNNFVFSTPALAARPAWVANSTSGVPAVRFSGSPNPELRGNLQRTLTNATIFTLGRFLDTGGGTRYIYSFGTRNFSGLMMTLARRDSDKAYHFDGAADWLADNVIPGTGFRVFSQVYGGDEPDRHQLAVNLQTVLDNRTTVGRAYSAIATNVVLGRAPGLGGFGGDLVEWIVYDRALSAEERLQVEEYLRQRAGLPPFFTPGSLDLTATSRVDYESSDLPAAAWSPDLGNRSVRLPAAADPAFLLAPEGPVGTVMQARLRSDGDHGFIGFVLGWNGAGNFLLFDWNRTATNHPVFGIAAAGMRLRSFHIPGGQPPTGVDFWSSPDPARVTLINSSATPWAPGVDYDLTIRTLPDRLELVVQQGTNTVVSWALPQLPDVKGRLGFYGFDASGANLGGLILPDAPLFVTSLVPEGNSEFTLRWMNGRPPYVIEASTSLRPGEWFEIAPATPNQSQRIPIMDNSLFLRVRGSGN